ncbi:MAG: thioredoxin family protein [Gammaproteobacteria bacterium]|nr:thioredoxin family protein [Gammaproteobacteria bacterium]
MACESGTRAIRKVSLTLAGAGETLLRLERRVGCAAGAAGFAPDLTLRKDYETLGLTISDTPALLHEGQVIFRGLPRTEEIESWLKIL